MHFKDKRKKARKSNSKSILETIYKFLEEKPIYVLGVLVLITYGVTLFNGFVWDDEEQIVNNAIIQNLRNFNLFLYGGTFNTGGTNNLSGWFFRPLINVNFAFLFAVFKFNAWGYHLFSITFHLINSILIFKILEFFNKLSSPSRKNLFPILLAGFFAVHPGSLEAVSYIAALGDLMVTFSAILSVFIILKYKDSLEIKYPFYMALAILFGLLYKESAFAVLPILIGFVLILRKIIVNFKTWIAFIIFPFLIYFLLRIPVASKALQSPHFSPISEASLYERLLTIPKLLLHYLTLYFYPHILSISQHFVVKNLSILDFYLPLFIVLLTFGALIYLYIKGNLESINKNILLVAIVWCFFSFGLISNIVPLDMTVAERWFYFPIIGMIIICYIALNALNEKYYRYAVIFLIAYCLLMIPFSIARNLNWKDGLTLYTHDIKINPNSFDLNNNVGVELVRAGKQNEGKIHFEKSIELQPKWHFAYNNLGAVYEGEGNFEKAEELYKKTLEMSDYHLALINLCALHTIKMKDYQKGEDSCTDAASKLPGNIAPWLHLTINKYQNGKQEEALNLATDLATQAPSQGTKYLYEKISKKEKLDL
jgi:tetratricopeptide (TPR) repeat protein